MYREEILDHYKRPRNTGSLETKHDAEGENPSCGDDTHIYLEVGDDTVEEMRHETDACAVCTAAISILSEELPGNKADEVENLNQDWMLEKLGIEVSPMRMKCALLGLETVKKALQK
jgi:nitrogen fixation NifU-like protein